MTADSPETPSPTPTSAPPAARFDELGLNPNNLDAVTRLGFETPTPIQAQAIPLLLDGKDVVGQARTGTGKTAAFVLPMLQRLTPSRRVVQALVLAPTRELALQVAEACREFAGPGPKVRVATVYGGQPMGQQIRQIRGGAQVVVGTPGRTLDLLRREVLRLKQVDFVVLDEADEMLQMGFIDDIEAILSHLPSERPHQTALFSATLSHAARRMAAAHTREPVQLKVGGGGLTVPDVEQQLIVLREANKVDVLDRLLEVEEVHCALVFVRTRLDCAALAERLDKLGHSVDSLHGDLSQQARERVMGRFRDARTRVLVATDVAARGLDVEAVTHVINFDPPDDPDPYVHRIGRTGRAGRKGVAITFAIPGQGRQIGSIERHIGRKLTRRHPPTSVELTRARGEHLRQRVRDAVDEHLAPELMEVQALVDEGLDLYEVAAAALRLACHRPLSAEPDPPSDWHPVPFRVPVGRRDRLRASDLVGALCKDAGLPGQAIGGIDIKLGHTEVWIGGRWADELAARGSIYLRHRPTPIRRADGVTPPPTRSSQQGGSGPRARRGAAAPPRFGPRQYGRGGRSGGRRGGGGQQRPVRRSGGHRGRR